MASVDLVRGGQYNIGHICTRQQCDLGYGSRLAFRWIAPDLERANYTFDDLELHSSRYANALQSRGFRAGEVLFVHLPKSPELFFAVLGALKLGLVVSAPFSRLAEPALVERMAIASAKGIVTRRRVARQLLRMRGAVPSLTHVLATDLEGHQADGILSTPALLAESSPDFLAEPTGASAPSLIHFTPGPTKRARAVLQVHGAVQHISATARDVLQVTPGDVFWCTADHGTVTGTSYGIIGPWSLGASQVHFGGGYTADGWFGIIEREQVSVWYTAPTVIRMLMREDPAIFARFDIARLKHIFSVGEWLEPAALEWSRRVLDRDVHDTYFQTETGGIVIANRPGVPIRPGSMGRPVDTIDASVFDDDGNAAPTAATGRLALGAGWPSMFAGYLGDAEAYRGKFQGGRYLTGDAARQDEDGYFWFGGRTDDIINTAGHLVGPAEVESALLECPEVAGCAVVRVPDAVFLEKVAAFVVLAAPYEPSEDLDLELKVRVSRRLSPVEAPQEIRFVDAIPVGPQGRIDQQALRIRFPELYAAGTLPWETR